MSETAVAVDVPSVADIPVPEVRRRRLSPVVALVPRLQRAGGSDARRTTALAVGAFAAMTALALSVVGGLLAFSDRVDAPGLAVPEGQRGLYVMFAWTALVVLVVPLLTLGGAAARLGVARRDARLAALRLSARRLARSSGSRSSRRPPRGSSARRSASSGTWR